MESGTEYIGDGRQRGELKHLSTRRNRKKTLDFLSSGERKGKSPNLSCLHEGGCGKRSGPSPESYKGQPSQSGLESPTIAGESPVGERGSPLWNVLPSSMELVELRVNPGGPSPKAKYYLATDSVIVARAKDEKHPC